MLLHKSRKTSDQAIQKFYDDFEDNPLVLDKWFSVQAMTPGAAGAKVVRRLMRHEKFTFKNPNQTDACGCGESVTIVPFAAE